MFEFTTAVNVTRATGNVVEGTMKGDVDFYVRSPRAHGAMRNALAIRAESVYDFLNYLDEHMPTARQKGSSDRSSSEYGGEFHTFRNYAEARDAFKNRPETLLSYDESNDDLTSLDSVGNEVVYDVTGDYIDVGRFIEGDPEHFGVMVGGNPNNLFATLVLNLSAPWYISKSVLAAKARRIMRLVDWMEGQGIRTEILAIKVSQCAYAEIVVKRFQDVLDMNALAIVSHPDFYRRSIFRVIEYSSTYESGYGTATSIRYGNLRAPKIEGNGIQIFCETQENERMTHANFDRIEAAIIKMNDEGGSTLNATC